MKTSRILVLLFAAWTWVAAPAAPMHFGLFSDAPYSAWEREQFPLLIAEMGAQPLAFVVHGGDIKNSSSACTDETYAAILEAFQGSRHPLVYVPGDNEWADCHHRLNAGFDPLERLDRLRALFWAGDASLGHRTMVLERQSRHAEFAAYRENVLWKLGGVLFVGLNLPGSENNYYGEHIGAPDRKGPVAEFTRRAAANRAWLAEAFALARREALSGILIVAHANPGFEAWNEGKTSVAYGDFLEQLRDEVQRFAGQVVLVHGDTHKQRIDQPMRDAASGAVVTNFRRVELFGYPELGWVRGTVDTEEPEVFRFEPRPWRRGGGAP